MTTAFEELFDDCERLTQGDPEIERALNYVWLLSKQKGIVYRELMQSKSFKHVKYILQEHEGRYTISDLDNGTEESFNGN